MVKAKNLKEILINDPSSAIEKLLEVSKSNPEIESESISLYRKAAEFNKKKIQGIFSEDEVSRKEAQIVSITLEIINKYEKLVQKNNLSNDKDSTSEPTKIEEISQAKKKSPLKISIQIAISVAITCGTGVGLYFFIDSILSVLILAILVAIAFFSLSGE